MFARTPRLTLRPGWPEDAPALAAAVAHEDIAFRLSRLPWPYTLAHAEQFLAIPRSADNVSCLMFAHEGDDAPHLIGCIGIHPAEYGHGHEIGYWLTPASWGRGYATEAGRAMLDVARYAMGLDRLVSGHFLDNPASGRVLRKLGFAQTGVEKRDCLARGVKVDCATFELAL